MAWAPIWLFPPRVMADPRALGADILLLGAGHANLLALPILRKSLPDARITLVDPAPRASYSGMFPGFIAGHYTADQLQVDLASLARRHGISFIRGGVTGIDSAQRRARLSVEGAEQTIAFGLAALDIGSHSAMPDMPGFSAHAIAAKPLGAFAEKITAVIEEGAAKPPMAVIGGGVAGVEIALALAHRFPSRVSLIEAGPQIAPALGAAARRRLMTALRRFQVQIVTGDPVARITESDVILQSSRRIDSGLTIGLAGARAQDWLARDLPTDAAGFVAVTPTLQVQGQPDLFAAGDCASMIHAPRPKAGVFAVRQGPILARNMVARHRGGRMQDYHPQRDYLKIISLGGQDAVAEWYGIALHGRWLWRWKDRIDRAFMRRLLK